ncbi:hypothetical protein, partial [Escherichia coli]|uniref:hypothetical protein n=1 Tax=Escherichia coli TaxID=562 RepID=UPI002875AA30
AWVLFGQIKKHILVYNEEMDVKLRELKRERAELRTKHKQAFERLDELQQISYTNAMARDASVYQRDDYDPEEFESEYYRTCTAWKPVPKKSTRTVHWKHGYLCWQLSELSSSAR